MAGAARFTTGAKESEISARDCGARCGGTGCSACANAEPAKSISESAHKTVRTERIMQEI